jgi:hypothetical protein
MAMLPKEMVRFVAIRTGEMTLATDHPAETALSEAKSISILASAVNLTVKARAVT